MNKKKIIDDRRRSPLSLELLGELEHRRVLFQRKFGRPHRRGEPLFFDPDAAQPRRMSRAARQRALAMVESLAGI